MSYTNDFVDGGIETDLQDSAHKSGSLAALYSKIEKSKRFILVRKDTKAVYAVEKFKQDRNFAAEKLAYEITNGSISKQLLLYFFPILIGSFLQQLYNTIDAAIVGNFVGKEALAAIGGTTGTLLNLFLNFYIGLSSGATVLISQYYGSRDKKLLQSGVLTAYVLGISGGALLMLMGLITAPLGLELIGAPESVVAYALIYLRICFIGLIPSSIYNIGFGILRAVGDFKRPLYFLTAACILNFSLDILFISIYQWGVAGAAIATVLSQTFSAVCISLYMFRCREEYQIMWKRNEISSSILKKMIHIGLPAGLQSVMYGISNIIIQAGVNTFDTNYIAACTVYDKLDGFYWMLLAAFGVSITTFVGQNFGAGKIKRIQESMKSGMLMTMGCSIAFSIISMMLGRVFFSLFTKDQNVIRIGLHLLYFLMPTYFTYVTIQVLSGVIRGVGESLMPMVITCFGVCLLRVIWILTMVPRWHTIEMLMVSYPISWTVTSIVFILYYKYGHWMKHACEQ